MCGSFIFSYSPGTVNNPYLNNVETLCPGKSPKYPVADHPCQFAVFKVYSVLFFGLRHRPLPAPLNEMGSPLSTTSPP